MSAQNTTRRDVLRRTVAGAGLAAFGTAVGSASGNDRKIVGLTADANFGVATDRADGVHRTLDFGDLGKAVAGNFSSQAIDQLSARGDVRYVETDGTAYALGPGNGNGGGGGSTGECLPWGIDRVDADVAHANGDTGSGADIAIIDTGIDSDHPDLQANVGEGKAFVSCKGGSCNYAWDDDDDHGTHCAGIAAAVRGNKEGVQGVSPDATLHAVKVLDNTGRGSWSDVAAGIKWAADQGYDVGSMSLGASSGNSGLKDAVQYADQQGLTMIVAAGNSGPCTDCVGYPAAYSECVAVSSTDSDDSLSSFSSTGPEVEIAAPGGSVYSSVEGGSYDTFSGTSMACPHVSGAAAQASVSKLKSSAEDLGLGSNEQGAGLLDVAAALGHDSSDDGTGDC